LSTRPAAACLLLLLICTATPLTAQQSEAHGYRQLVDDYRRYGASAVPRAATLTEDQIASGRKEIAGSWEEQRAAAILHTEAMLTLADGGQLSAASHHLDTAASLLDDVIEASPSQSDFAYRWYSLTQRLLRHFRASKLADGLAYRATARFSARYIAARHRLDDALLFELQGCEQGMVLSAQGPVEVMQLSSRWWMSAARLFRELLESDWGLPAEEMAALTSMSALHMGRIRMLEGTLDQATPYFERALGAVDPRVRYLAMLFLGSLDERADRLEQAEKRYRDAMAGYPWGQAAHLALAQILSRTGRDDEARTTLLDRFGRPDERLIEPLWTYVIRPEEELPKLFDELRAEVWR
jgi:tetratricopeptide repeat protein